jgi:CheY-like chemotaxis protein
MDTGVLDQKAPRSDTTSQIGAILVAQVCHAAMHDRPLFLQNLWSIGEKHGGTVLTLSPNTLMIGFNIPYPTPLYNDLALLTAFEMLHIFANLRTDLGSGAELQIGLDLGEVQVAFLKTQGFNIKGYPVQTAQALAEHCEDGCIIVSDRLFHQLSWLSQKFEIINREAVAMAQPYTPQLMYRLRPSAPKTQRFTPALNTDELKPAQILIAEDDSHLRTAFAKVLKHAGYEVALAADSKQALQYLQQIAPDVVILDLGLPGASGLKIMDHLRSVERYRNTRVIVVTGNHLALQSEAIDLADLLLIKPVSTRDLVSFVKRLIS